MSFNEQMETPEQAENTFDKLMKKRFTPEQQQKIKEAVEKKINAIKNEKAK